MVKFKISHILMFAFLGGSAVSMWTFAEEQEISLDKVPATVIQAAENALPGIRFTEAEIELEDGVEVYELEGEREGKQFEIEVTGDGTILEIEEDS